MSTALAPALLLGLAALLLTAPAPGRLRRVLSERAPATAAGAAERRWSGDQPSLSAVAGWWSGGRRPAGRSRTGRAGAGGAAAAASAGVLAVALGLALAATLVLGAGGAAAVVLLLLGVSAAVRARGRAAAAAEERAGALAACGVLAAELRAGRPPADALAAAAAPARGAFAARLSGAAAAARLGGDPAAVMVGHGGAPATAVPVLAAGLAACWRVCSRSGAGLAAAVERLEDGLRAAETARRSVEAELAGPRATAALLAVLPLAGIGLAAALGARPLQVLLGSGLGQLCLVLGVALDVAGVLWTRRLAAGADVRA